MYNWSVDEVKFKSVKGIIEFLKQIPEVLNEKIVKRKDKWNNIVIKTRLASNIHPAKKVYIEHSLKDRMGNLQISIIESK